MFSILSASKQLVLGFCMHISLPRLFLNVVMSDCQNEKATFINPFPVRDVLVSGKEMGLPMVDYISANHRFSAGRMSWHSHDGHEILLLLSGSTGYEFRSG